MCGGSCSWAPASPMKSILFHRDVCHGWINIKNTVIEPTSGFSRNLSLPTTELHPWLFTHTVSQTLRQAQRQSVCCVAKRNRQYIFTLNAYSFFSQSDPFYYYYFRKITPIQLHLLLSRIIFSSTLFRSFFCANHISYNTIQVTVCVHYKNYNSTQLTTIVELKWFFCLSREMLSDLITSFCNIRSFSPV